MKSRTTRILCNELLKTHFLFGIQKKELTNGSELKKLFYSFAMEKVQNCFLSRTDLHSTLKIFKRALNVINIFFKNKKERRKRQQIVLKGLSMPKIVTGLKVRGLCDERQRFPSLIIHECLRLKKRICEFTFVMLPRGNIFLL